MVGKYSGELVGLRQYDKDGKTQYVYNVFCTGSKKDSKTGLYFDGCSVANIIEDHEAIKDPVYGMQVDFYGEMVNGKNGSFMKFSDITPSAAGSAK